MYYRWLISFPCGEKLYNDIIEADRALSSEEFPVENMDIVEDSVRPLLTIVPRYFLLYHRSQTLGRRFLYFT